MPRFFAALAAVLLLVVVGLGVSRREAAAPHPEITVVVPPRAVTTSTIDWRPGVRYVVGRQRADLDRYLNAVAVRLAHEAYQRAGLVPHVHTLSVPGTTDDYTMWADWPLWSCTMRHESGGSWTFQTSSYAGAFAIARSTWRAFAGVYARRWPNAALAPPAEQIRGARLVRAHVGSLQWGGLRWCLTH